MRSQRLLIYLRAVVICLGAAWFGAAYGRTLLISNRMAADNDRLEQRALQLKHENQRLTVEAAQLQTDAGRERQARKDGWVRKGEVPLVIPK